MLAAIRQFSKSWVAVVLFMLLLVSLIIWGGMSDMFKNTVSTGVVSVGSRSISAAEFEQRFNAQLEQISKQQNNGQPVSRDEAIKAGFHERILQSLAARLSVTEAVSRLGVRPAPALIAAELQKIPQLFDEVTGRFDKAKYRQLLQENHLTVQTFEDGIRDDLAIQHLGAGLEAGMQPPRVFGALYAISQMENRSWSAFTVDLSKLPPPAKPTDAQLTAFMNENADRLRKPETRELSIVRFSSRAIQDQMTVDPAEVQKLYEFRKDTLSKPEMRTVVQVPAKNQAQAQQIAQRLSKGEEPAAVAKAFGVEPIVFSDKPKSAISDKKVAEAAFSTPAGQVSAPVQGDLGFAVVKVLDVKPGLVTSLEAARPQLEAQLKHDAAQKKVYAGVEAYEKAHDGGATLAEAAKAANATVISTGQVAQNGRTLKGDIAPGVGPGLLQKAFTMAQGEESDVEDEGDGEYYAVRVEKVNPPAMPSLEEVRAQVTDAYMQQQQRKALQAKADELAARVRKGESLEAVAASIGASVNHAVAVDRQTAAQQVQTVGAELLQGVFNGKKGDVVVASAPKFSMIVAKVEDVKSGDVAKMAQVAEVGRMQARQQLLSEMFDQTQAAARAMMKPKINTKRAAQALGITEAPPAPADKKAK